MDKENAVKSLKSYLNFLIENKINVKEAYLFGSYAKNTNNQDSDIDVAIIVNKINGDYFTTTPLLWKLRRQIDDRIEPILFEKGNDKSGFIDEIKKFGIEIS